MPVILALTVGSLFADTLPAFVVQAVATDDTAAYTAALAKINTVIKARAGVEKLRHTWEGDYAGDSSHGIFVVSSFASAAAAQQLADKLKGDPELDGLVKDLKGIRKLGPSWLYKGIRNDGLYEGGGVFNTSIVCTDEDAYVKALAGLKAIFDANGFKDAKINLWRIVSGRKDSTHLVIISLASQERVAELLDTITDKALLKDWNVAAAKIRTTVQNGTYHEITK